MLKNRLCACTCFAFKPPPAPQQHMYHTNTTTTSLRAVVDLRILLALQARRAGWAASLGQAAVPATAMDTLYVPSSLSSLLPLFLPSSPSSPLSSFLHPPSLAPSFFRLLPSFYPSRYEGMMGDDLIDDDLVDVATVLMVAEKPSIAAAIATALRGGGDHDEGRGRSEGGRCPVHEFAGIFQGKPCQYRVTSVTGIYMCNLYTYTRVYGHTHTYIYLYIYCI